MTRGTVSIKSKFFETGVDFFSTGRFADFLENGNFEGGFSMIAFVVTIEKSVLEGEAALASFDEISIGLGGTGSFDEIGGADVHLGFSVKSKNTMRNQY